MRLKGQMNSSYIDFGDASIEYILSKMSKCNNYIVKKAEFMNSKEV